MIANKLSTTRFTTVVLLSIAFNAILLYTCTLATRTMKFYFDFHTFKYSRIVSRCLLFIGAYFLKHHHILMIHILIGIKKSAEALIFNQMIACCQLQTHLNALGCKILFGFRNGVLTKVENGCSQYCICATF